MVGSYIGFASVDEGTPWIINDRSVTGQPNMHADPPYFFISVDNVDGLHGNDMEVESHPIPHADGEIIGDIFRRGTTITLSGKIYGLSLGALEQGVDYLRQMFQEKTHPRELFWKRFDGVEVYVVGRVNQDLQIVESVEAGKYEWDWVVGIRLDNKATYNSADDGFYPALQDGS